MSIFDRDNFNQSDAFWRDAQNFHVYQQAFEAANPAPGSTLVWNTAGAAARYEIGLARARALDVARKELIEAHHAAAVEAFGAAAANVTRSIDGGPETEVKL